MSRQSPSPRLPSFAAGALIESPTCLKNRMESVAIVLARAGSKGVPGKNRAPVAGKPCVLWTIEQAQASERVGLVAVSTDDAAVKRQARRAGCIVVDRPAELATDKATVDDAARHAVAALEASGALARIGDGLKIVILYANVPVRPAGLIDGALDLLERSGCDSVQSYAQVGKFHPYWTARVDARSGEVTPWQGKVLNHGIFRRQDLPPAFIPDGGVIALTRRALFCKVKGVAKGPHAFFGRARRGIINPEGSVIDIDSPIDLLLAGSVLGAARASKPAKKRPRPRRVAPHKRAPLNAPNER